MLPEGAEVESWEHEVNEAGGSELPFPWFAYRWASEEHSLSMLNRRRIWRILKQMEELPYDVIEDSDEA
jgi:hypothetical protein